jgi:predicted nucleic acid-binding protein
MTGLGATPLFVDTGAFFAHVVENSPRHERARAVMNAIHAGDLHFRPLYTTGYVLGELTTLILREKDHKTALDTLNRIRRSPAVRVFHPDASQFDTACERFEQFDDQHISFVDHTTAALAEQFDTDHVFAFDSDFGTMGFSLVPDDIALPE